MDIRNAIDAHVELRNRLAAYLAHPDQSLDAAAVAIDDQCLLGRWLRGEGVAESGWAGYAQLVRDHARFHQEAAKLVRRANAGEHITEEVALGSKSEYTKASNAVTTALLLIKCKQKQAARSQPAARPDRWMNEGFDADLAVPSLQHCGARDSLAAGDTSLDSSPRSAIPRGATPRGERAAS
jgi:hypothetical protein